MTEVRARTRVDGSLWVEGPAGPFRVVGRDAGVEVRLDSLRQLRSLRRARPPERLAEGLDRAGLAVAVVLRNRTVASRAPGDGEGVRVHWPALALAGLTGLLP